VEFKAQKRVNAQRAIYRELKTAFDVRFNPAGKKRCEETIAICEGMIDILSACFSVPSVEIRSNGRANAPVSRVRQIGMYVCHVALGLTMLEVAAGFVRDRSTIVYACHLIEDMRDDIEFDTIVGTIERIAQAAFGAFSER
jgi:chromosomal replication initiation ATPase DnaA